jgi:hypothetical protein
MSKWRYTIKTEEAGEELASFLASPQIGLQLRNHMRMLASESDPRTPVSKTLDVTLLSHDCPTWYRLKLANIRMIFSLWQHRQGKLREYDPGEKPWADCENTINIEQVGYRDETTYAEARRCWRKSHGK